MVQNQTLTWPHATFNFYSGRSARVWLGDQVVGFCFEGNASMEYVSALALEHPVMTYNLAHGGLEPAIKRPDGLHIGTPFTRAMFWVGGADLQPSSGVEGPTLDSTFRALTTLFGNNSLRFGLTGVQVRLANGGTLPFYKADLDGGKFPFVYELDPFDRTESFFQMSNVDFNDPSVRGYLWPVTLSQQPVGWDLHQPQPATWLLRSVDLELTQTGGFQAQLKVRESLQPSAAGLKVLQLNFQSIHWGNDGRHPVSHHASIVKVLDERGQSLAFRQDRNEVIVFLSTPTNPSMNLNLEFQIEGDFLVPPTNGNYWKLGTSAWYPQPDLNGQMHTWHAVVRVQKPNLAFSCGDTVRRWTEGAYEVVETKSEFPIAFGVVLAGEYSIQRETRKGLTVEVAIYGGSAQFTKALVDISFQAIGYYENFLGPYPFKEFHILEQAEWGYGQAPASIMFITKEAFNQSLEIINKFFSQGIRGRFVHEIAHQWWGTVVKMPSFQEQWLTEAFAESCSSLCLQDWPQKRGASEYSKMISHWKTEAAQYTEISTIPLANRIYNPTDSWEQFRARTGLIYSKGAWLLHCIRLEIGDQAYFTFLNAYQKNFRWKFGSTRDVAGLLGAITKKDWKPWFEKNYWGTGLPEGMK